MGGFNAVVQHMLNIPPPASLFPIPMLGIRPCSVLGTVHLSIHPLAAATPIPHMVVVSRVPSQQHPSRTWPCAALRSTFAASACGTVLPCAALRHPIALGHARIREHGVGPCTTQPVYGRMARCWALHDTACIRSYGTVLGAARHGLYTVVWHGVGRCTKQPVYGRMARCWALRCEPVDCRQ